MITLCKVGYEVAKIGIEIFGMLKQNKQNFIKKKPHTESVSNILTVKIVTFYCLFIFIMSVKRILILQLDF